MYKLIIVDDESSICEGIAACYPRAKMGFEMAGTFPNGRSALDYIGRYLVDVILSDIRMPKMDGLELPHVLPKDYPDVTVVLLSGYAKFEYAREALRFEVKEYILRPIRYDTIIQVFTKIRGGLDASRRVRKIDEQSPGYYDLIVDQVTQYVDERFQNADPEDASILVSLSPNYLSKIFRRKKGRNFSEYVLDVKMERAAGLLHGITLKTYEVAAVVGYDNPKNLSRAFKQYCEKTPREFREQKLPI